MNFNQRFKELAGLLLEQSNEAEFWSGELSSSALSTAVAIVALHAHSPEQNRMEIETGINWLEMNINDDGSYGDTPESPGNISTSLLVYAALNLYADKKEHIKDVQNKVAGYLYQSSIDVRSDQFSSVILNHYKKDLTFSVPILTLCALCGVPGDEGFRKIPQLPFELALLPKQFYRMLNLNVVSYAIPALIAVGIVIFKKKKASGFSKWIRKGSEKKALQLLHNSLPESGGFLEAIPLTAFVALSLIHAGHNNSEVVEKGIAFLKKTQRKNGGWPIDVDLSTWVTSLSIKALRSQKDEILSSEQQKKLTAHLKAVQNKVIHPFNGTGPGGWGWTNFSGSVPDGDDTPGAILALLRLQNPEDVKDEVLAGIKWLLQLQNTDGGFPTFSKGWGKLPFDQSCSDLTGHAFLAMATVLNKYRDNLDLGMIRHMNKSLNKSLNYLQNKQFPNGSWLPLWFGNQQTGGHKNPVYGTARVVTYLRDAMVELSFESEWSDKLLPLIEAGTSFLTGVQNADSSWGGDTGIPGTIEETALAISALSSRSNQEICQKGFEWLEKYYEDHGLKAAPIGLYFASLWYDEKMYPLTAWLEAVTRYMEL